MSDNGTSRRGGGAGNRFADLHNALKGNAKVDTEENSTVGTPRPQNGKSEISADSPANISLKRNSEDSERGVAGDSDEDFSANSSVEVSATSLHPHPPVMTATPAEVAASSLSIDSTDSTQGIAHAVPESEVAPRRGPGRPAGKKSSREYCQVGAYIPLDLYDDLKEELARSNRGRRRSGEPPVEISGVVEMLLRDWIDRQRDERVMNR